MMNQIIVTGMVLSITPIAEYDRRVVILTREQGKISAFAKGARRPNSPLVGTVNPFSFGEFTLYAGRSSYTIQSVQINNYFSELRSDMIGAYYGFYFLELADYYAREGNDERELLKLLYQTLRALSNSRIPNELIRYIYELKAFCINGMAPQVFQCACCGSTDGLTTFSARKGGVICHLCGGKVSDGIRMDKSTLYTLQFIVGSKVESLYSFSVSAPVLNELGRVMKRFCEAYFDRSFKSLEILNTLE